jgi:hypothetical protein
MTQNQIKQLVSFCFIFVILLFGFERCIDFVVRQSNYGYYGKINKIANHEADPKIAFFGSSVGDVSLDPKVISRNTGFSAYNFCIDGTRFIQYNGLIKELNSYSENCELVVLAETFFTLSGVDQLTEVDRFLAHVSIENVYTSLYEVQPELLWKIKYIPFYKFVIAKQGYYKAAAYGLKTSFSASKEVDSLNGFTPKDKNWEVGLDELNKYSLPIDIQINRATVNQYRKTIKELRNRGRKVLIIIPPIHEAGLKLLPDLGKVISVLDSMQEDGVYFRNFSRIKMSEEKRYFYNNSHVNRSGAEVFSSILSQSVDSILVKQD